LFREFERVANLLVEHLGLRSLTRNPDIRVHLQGDGFLFHGCTGVPKEMRYDPTDAATPFKGRAFGFRYGWSRAE
jgi:hypothetical protein